MDVKLRRNFKAAPNFRKLPNKSTGESEKFLKKVRSFYTKESSEEPGVTRQSIDKFKKDIKRRKCENSGLNKKWNRKDQTIGSLLGENSRKASIERRRLRLGELIRKKQGASVIPGNKESSQKCCYMNKQHALRDGWTTEEFKNSLYFINYLREHSNNPARVITRLDVRRAQCELDKSKLYWLRDSEKTSKFPFSFSPNIEEHQEERFAHIKNSMEEQRVSRRIPFYRKPLTRKDYAKLQGISCAKDPVDNGCSISEEESATQPESSSDTSIQSKIDDTLCFKFSSPREVYPFQRRCPPQQRCSPQELRPPQPSCLPQRCCSPQELCPLQQLCLPQQHCSLQELCPSKLSCPLPQFSTIVLPVRETEKESKKIKYSFFRSNEDSKSKSGQVIGVNFSTADKERGDWKSLNSIIPKSLGFEVPKRFKVEDYLNNRCSKLILVENYGDVDMNLDWEQPIEVEIKVIGPVNMNRKFERQKVNPSRFLQNSNVRFNPLKQSQETEQDFKKKHGRGILDMPIFLLELSELRNMFERNLAVCKIIEQKAQNFGKL